MELLLRDMRERDERDMQRKIAPLKKAEDAVCIDCSDLSIDEVVERIRTLVKERF